MSRAFLDSLVFTISVGQQLLNRHMTQITQLVFSPQLPLRIAALQFFGAAVRLNSCHPSIFHLPLITLTGDQQLDREKGEILGLLSKVLTSNNIPKFPEIIQAGYRLPKPQPTDSTTVPHFGTFFHFLNLKKLKTCRQAFLKALVTFFDFSGGKALHPEVFTFF